MASVITGMPFSPGALKFWQGVQKDYIKKHWGFAALVGMERWKEKDLEVTGKENDPNGPWDPGCLEAEAEVVATAEIHSLMSPCRGGGHMMVCKWLWLQATGQEW